MKFTQESRKKTALWIIGIAAACIVIFLGIQNINIVTNAVKKIFGLIAPLILGFVFAVIFNVPMSFFEGHLWKKAKNKVLRKLRRPVSFIISLIFIFGILVGIIMLVIPELVAAIKVILQEIIDFVNRLSRMNQEELAKLPFGELLLKVDWNDVLFNLQEWLKSQGSIIINTALDTAIGTISSLVGGIVDFFVAFAFSIYILFNKETLKNQCARLIKAWIPKGFGGWFIHTGEVLNENFRNFISGQTLEAVILGVLCILGMWILRIPYAPMVGTLVGVTALIPVVGAFIGTIVGAFMIVTVQPIKALVFIIFLLVLQQIEGNIIYPKVMGSRVNLPAMWILAAVTIGGSAAGPVGMLLGVPLASSVYILLKEATEKREEKLFPRDISEEAEKNE